jgi:hypothetical protein
MPQMRQRQHDGEEITIKNCRRVICARARICGRANTPAIIQSKPRHKKNPKITYALGGTEFVASLRFSEPGGGVSGMGAARPDLIAK